MKLAVGAASALVAALLAGGTPAQATTIDLSTWTCAKFSGGRQGRHRHHPGMDGRLLPRRKRSAGD